MDTKKFLFFVIVITFVFSGNTVNAVTPAAISDLLCRVFSNNTIILSWTEPAGLASSDAHEAKYVQGNTINYSDANVFSQNWVTAAAGSTREEEVTGLSPNTQFTFAIKTSDASSSWSDISNIVTCTTAGSAGIVDNLSPSSKITYPLDGSVLSSGINYLVSGSSFDNGSSSVKKVEISFDGGQTWKIVTPKNTTGSGFTWEYLWVNPAVGNYSIKTKATDWWDNIESNNIAVSIQVTSGASSGSSTATDTSKTTLNARIIVLQQQIIQLILQLINLLKTGA